MKNRFVIVTCLLTACNTSQVKQGDQISMTALHGCYTADDGTGYNTFFLNIASNYSFTARVRGDIGDWGKAEGSWQVQDNLIMLETTHSVDSLKTLSGPMYIFHQGSKYALDFDQKTKVETGHWSRFSRVACGSN